MTYFSFVFASTLLALILNIQAEENFTEVVVGTGLQVDPNVNIDVRPVAPFDTLTTPESPLARVLDLEENQNEKEAGKKKGEKCFSIFGLGSDKDDTREAVQDQVDSAISNPIADVPGRYPYPEYAVSSVNFPSRGRMPMFRRLSVPMQGSFRKISPRNRPLFPRRAPAKPIPIKPYKLAESYEPTRSEVKISPNQGLQKINSAAQDKGRFFWSSHYEYPDYYYDYDYEYGYPYQSYQSYQPYGGYYW